MKLKRWKEVNTCLEKKEKKKRNKIFTESLCLAPFLYAGTASMGNTCWTPKYFTLVCIPLAKGKRHLDTIFYSSKARRDPLFPLHSSTAEGESLLVFCTSNNCTRVLVTVPAIMKGNYLGKKKNIHTWSSLESQPVSQSCLWSSVITDQLMFGSSLMCDLDRALEVKTVSSSPCGILKAGLEESVMGKKSENL